MTVEGPVDPETGFVMDLKLLKQALEARVVEDVDVMISPSYAGGLLLITNNTGHPSLTLRCGFKADGTPHGITLWGRLFDEGTLCRVGMALERQLDVWDRRPPL